MPLYFFHIQDHKALVEDLEGTDLPDEGSAHSEAVGTARTILADSLRAGREPTGHAVLIVDKEGRPIDVVRFADVLPDKVKDDLMRE